MPTVTAGARMSAPAAEALIVGTKYLGTSADLRTRTAYSERCEMHGGAGHNLVRGGPVSAVGDWSSAATLFEPVRRT